MRFQTNKVLLVTLATVSALSGKLCAQELNCKQVHAMGQMARARSVSELKSLRTFAGDDYRARLVFAFRALELERTELTASAVLEFLLNDDSHLEEWYSLSGLICREEQDRDVTSLARLQARMSRDFAKSVMIYPQKMYEYVSYPVRVGLSPHDDYAEQMTTVCRKHHREFNAAIKQLPEKDRDWLLRVVFEPSGCRALAHPEAD